jgi:low affinity Fe/Cu permease
MNNILFKSADFLSRPPGFYTVLGLMAVCILLIPLGLTDLVTFALSVAAIVITGVVLIQGYRDTAAIHAKLDEIVIALRETETTWSGSSIPTRRSFRRQSRNWKRKPRRWV